VRSPLAWSCIVIPLPGQRGAISSAGERFVHTEEVTGSIPVSPTQVRGYFRPFENDL
jgi:hypothetical protein